MSRTNEATDRNDSPGRVPAALMLLTASALALLAPPARAAITGLDTFGNMVFAQTGPTQTSLTGDFFSSRVYYGVAGDVTSGTASFSTTAPGLTYAYQTGTTYDAIAQTGFLSSTAFAPYVSPSGATMTVSTTGNLGAQQGVVTFGPTLFPTATPTVTAASYNLLQGLNASTAATVNFTGFTAAAGATSSYSFITITNASTNAVVFSESFLNPSTTSFSLLANTLAAGTSYNLEIDDSNRATSTIGTGSAAFVGQTYTAGFDTRTEIGFTTAPATVPEPASLALTALGVASVALLLRRRSRRAT